MHWTAIGPDELALVLLGMEAQVDAIGLTSALDGPGGPQFREGLL